MPTRPTRFRVCAFNQKGIGTVSVIFEGKALIPIAIHPSNHPSIHLGRGEERRE
jgi:hypothetical protein